MRFLQWRTITCSNSVLQSGRRLEGQIEKNAGCQAPSVATMPDFPDLAALNDWLEWQCVRMGRDPARSIARKRC
jgi:hypothetical protein